MFDFDVVTGPMPDRKPSQGEPEQEKSTNEKSETGADSAVNRVNRLTPGSAM